MQIQTLALKFQTGGLRLDFARHFGTFFKIDFAGHFGMFFKIDFAKHFGALTQIKCAFYYVHFLT